MYKFLDDNGCSDVEFDCIRFREFDPTWPDLNWRCIKEHRYCHDATRMFDSSANDWQQEFDKKGYGGFCSYECKLRNQKGLRISKAKYPLRINGHSLCHEGMCECLSCWPWHARCGYLCFDEYLTAIDWPFVRWFG